MARTRTETKTKKEREFVTISFDCDDATLELLNEIADLAAVTLDQAVSVILAMYISEVREIKVDDFNTKSQKRTKR